MNSQKVYLMILDGFGEGKDYPGNAITHASTPNLDRLRKNYPWTLLKAHGEAVGLPEGTQGGSEVGHFTIGAGRVIFQTLEEINRSIRNESFFTKKPFLDALEYIKKSSGSLHLLGMISDQGIHAHLNHLFTLLELAKQHQIRRTYIHAITDGRDVPERTAREFIEQIQQKIKDLKMDQEASNSRAKIATIIGRYFAMDRDKNWDRTEQAYNLYTFGQGIAEKDPLEAIENAYRRDVKTDYYIDPILLDSKGCIHDQDSVIFWNFRTDRTRQITECFTGENQIGFKPQKTVRPFFVCFGDYSKKAPVVFPTPVVNNNLGSIIEKNELKQLRIAETEKYAHVTYFFNSQIEKPFEHEERILIDSSKVPSYAQKPEMSAREMTDRVIKEIEREDYDLIVQNFANPDLVGHSGDFEATVKAIEVLDECIGKITETALQYGYNLIITADHGNAEYKIYEENGQPCPSHSTNPVIFLLVSEQYKQMQLQKNGNLEDIAPTVLKMMDIEKPEEMTGKVLF